MPEKIRVLLNFRKPDAQLVADAIGYYDGLRDNSNFQNPPIPLDEFKGKIDVFASAVAAAADGGTKAIIERNTLRENLTTTIRRLGHWVEANCKDDLTILKSSGFQQTSISRTPPQPLTQPIITKVQNGAAAGQVTVQVKPIPKALSYEVRCTSIDAEGRANSWTLLPPFTSSRPFSVNGLSAGTVYAFQVRALGKLGYTEWSGSVNRMSM